MAVGLNIIPGGPSGGHGRFCRDLEPSGSAPDHRRVQDRPLVRHALGPAGFINPRMKFGLHYLLSCAEGQSPAHRYDETLEQATHAESLGFESVWPVEHHFNSAAPIRPCPALFLAAVAARTSTIRLG